VAFDGILKGIEKSYGACHANQGVDLHVRAGTIHALIGENGAGKSTAMKILFGSVKPDAGVIRFGKEEVTDWSPERAFRHGIGMVHQHFMLAMPETVHDNLVLGAETTRFGVRERKAEAAALEALMKQTGLELPLDQPVETLPIGLQSRCEILKVLYRKARFLILDEPTSVLTPQEVEDFLKTLKALRKAGNTILIVTHKLKEIMAVADDATVLRAGRTVATRKIADTSVEELSELMVGRRLQMPRVKAQTGKSAQAPLARLSYGGLSLELKPGEITGIAGVEGNGQERLIHAFVDPHATALEAGHENFSFELLGKDASEFDTSQIRRLPVAIIPADRHHDGLVLSFTLTENLRLGREQTRARGLFRGATTEERQVLTDFDVRPNNPQAIAKGLSGGNQQKLIVARELATLTAEALGRGGVVLAVHPTRGVDLGAIEFIHGRLLEAARAGAAVLLVSSELDELMALSHRIGVVYRGSIVQWFEGPPYDEKALGLTMMRGQA
jgi:simple sugar transport system ATP-binding protein